MTTLLTSLAVGIIYSVMACCVSGDCLSKSAVQYACSLPIDKR